MSFGKATRFLLIISVACICTLLVLQFSYYLLLPESSRPLEKADLLVVFPGEHQRIDTAVSLARENTASYIAVINKTAAQLEKELEATAPELNVRLLSGDTSRSTFEDAFHTVEIIQQHNFDSVILVTSKYHMPRSLFLLKLHLLARNHKVAVQHFSYTQPNGRLTRLLTVYYNEIIKFWGSAIELAGNRLTGKLMHDSEWFRNAAEWIHQYILLGN